jgi:hypothetical protein
MIRYLGIHRFHAASVSTLASNSTPLTFYAMHPSTAHFVDLVVESALLVHVGDLVRTTNTPPINEDIRNGAAAGVGCERGLEGAACREGVELDDVGGGCDGVCVEEEGFGAAGEGTGGFREDDDWEKVSDGAR